MSEVAEKVAALAPLEPPVRPSSDWLVQPWTQRTGVYRNAEVGAAEIALDNGLIRRAWRLEPNAATVAFDNLMTGASMLRGVKPEARLILDGEQCDVGGLCGQEEYAYLRPEWVDAMGVDENAFCCVDFEVVQTQAHIAWKRKRYAANSIWPPTEAGLVLHFEVGAWPGLAAALTLRAKTRTTLPG